MKSDIPEQKMDTRGKEEVVAEISIAAGIPIPAEITDTSVSALAPGLKGEARPIEFPIFIHQYLREYISFADQKAGFIFVGVSTLLAYLVSQQATASVTVAPQDWSAKDVCGIISLLMLSISAVLALGVIIPRLAKLPGSSAIFWNDIASCPSAADYLQRVEDTLRAGAFNAVIEHCFILAHVCKLKYLCLQLSIYAAFIGFFVMLDYMFLKQ